MTDGKDRAPNWEQMERLIEAVKGGESAAILDELDGTKGTYFSVMFKWFANKKADQATPAELTALVDEWYTLTRQAWNGYVDFSQPSLSDVATGTKGGDNADLTAAVSTNLVAGQDDYAGLPLFACVDCNFEVDPVTLEPVITAIAGITGGFERNNPDKMVGVLQQSGFVYKIETATVVRVGYTATFMPYAKIWPLAESVRPGNNGMRPWVVHAKYLNHTVDGKLTSYSGPIPTAYNISHNSLHTLAAATGAGYSGMCYCDWTFLQLMFWIKYASLSADGILQGCLVNNLTAEAAVSEVGVKRILIAASGAPAFEAGMGVLVGEKNSNNQIDRGSASCYNISTNAGCKITAVEDLTIGADEYKAIYVDVDEAFDTTANSTCIATFHWPNGSCDNILGNDGSPASPTTGKYPAKLQGIEYSVGGYEVLADAILDLFKDGDDYLAQAYTVDKVAKQTTSITGDYKPSGVVVDQPASATGKYIKHQELSGGMFFPDLFGGSSSTYYKDVWYFSAQTVGLHEFLLFGPLTAGTAGNGLSCAGVSNGLSSAHWPVVSRPSPNGNRGEWQA